MGREATCTAHLTGKLASATAKPSKSSKRATMATTATSAGKALLETAELIFRGDFRVALPLRAITHVEADASNLTVTFAGGTLVLQLGPQASKWAERIRNPPSRLDKLGVKSTSTVALVGGGAADPLGPGFIRELEGGGAKVVRVPRAPGVRVAAAVDIIFLAVESKADLRALKPLRRSMRDDAAIWILRPKGSLTITEGDVRAWAKDIGLVDVKVAAFSPTHTAEKVVIPVAARASADVRSTTATARSRPRDRSTSATARSRRRPARAPGARAGTWC